MTAFGMIHVRSLAVWSVRPPLCLRHVDGIREFSAVSCRACCDAAPNLCDFVELAECTTLSHARERVRTYYRDPQHGSMWDDPNAVRFTDKRGLTWRVIERATTDVPGARGPRCLIFLRENIVRRAWKYPANWRSLSAADLEALTATA